MRVDTVVDHAHVITRRNIGTIVDVQGGSRARQKRIMKELRALQAPDKLPLAAAAAIFLRTDEDRIDIVRDPLFFIACICKAGAQLC